MAGPHGHRAPGLRYPSLRQVVHRRRRGGRGSGVQRAGLDLGPEIVVGGSGLGVPQCRVGGTDLLEPLLIDRIRVAVGVQSLGVLTVGRVDRGRGGVRHHSEHGVVIGTRPFPGTDTRHMAQPRSLRRPRSVRRNTPRCGHRTHRRAGSPAASTSRRADCPADRPRDHVSTGGSRNRWPRPRPYGVPRPGGCPGGSTPRLRCGRSRPGWRSWPRRSGRAPPTIRIPSAPP